MADPVGRERLRRYFAPYLATARERGVGFILDTATWRANAGWGRKLGYGPQDLDRLNREAVALAVELRDAQGPEAPPIVINGAIGPRGDGYKADERMTPAEAEHYHAAQVHAFAGTEADMVSAITIPYPEEAIGIARAAHAAGMPVVISFTVETDGTLPSGDALGAAIEQVDEATAGAPAYYMINCAHPTHFAGVLKEESIWLDRVRGIRANASTASHAELDAATELDAGDPEDLGRRYGALRRRLGRFSIMGGCCGTDHRHIAAICEACLPDASRPQGSPLAA